MNDRPVWPRWVRLWSLWLLASAVGAFFPLGLLLGIPHWLVLRRHAPRASLWLPATFVGLVAAFLIAGIVAVQTAPLLSLWLDAQLGRATGHQVWYFAFPTVAGLAGGVALGLLQTLALLGTGVGWRGLFWWPAAIVGTVPFAFQWIRLLALSSISTPILPDAIYYYAADASWRGPGARRRSPRRRG